MRRLKQPSFSQRFCVHYVFRRSFHLNILDPKRQIVQLGQRSFASPAAPGLVSSASMHKQIQIIRLDQNGEYRETSMSLIALKNETRLHLREVLQLDQPSVQPRILPRRHCILLTIGFIRAIVFTDRVYLLTWRSQPAKDYARSLSNHLQHVYGRPVQPQNVLAVDLEDQEEEAGSMADMGGFETEEALDRAASAAQYSGRPEDAAGLELVVLEHALLTVYGRQRRRVAYAQQLLNTLLGRVNALGHNDGMIYALFPLANTLTHYEMVSKGLCECIRALLDDDRDMREACLSEKVRLSQQVFGAALDLSRSHASAYDPLAMTASERSSADRVESEGADAYLGQTVSPIGSHAHVLRVLESNPAAGGVLLPPVPTSPLHHTAEELISGTVSQEHAKEWKAALTSVTAAAPFARIRSLDDEADEASRVLQQRGRSPLVSPMFLDRRDLSEDSVGASKGGGNGREDSRVQPILRISGDVLSQLELMLER
jgi:hypothetical protein